MTVDVSIIIPTWNRLWCLPEAIASCRQNSCSTEIIVVDDGSSDGTWEWLQGQPDIVRIRQSNWGKDSAVNKGFAISRGMFVRFLDSDDRLPPGATDEQVTIGKEADADIVVAGHIFSDEPSGESRFLPWTHCDDFVAQQLGECDSSHYSAFLFRRQFIADVSHRQEFGPVDDRMFVIEVALKRPKVAVYEGPGIIHCSHGRDRLQFPKGIRSVVTNWQHLQIYKKAATMLAAQGELTPRRKKAITGVLWPLAHWIAYTHLDEACDVAQWIYELDPEFTPPVSGILGALYRNLGFGGTERLLRVRRLMKSSRIPARKVVAHGMWAASSSRIEAPMSPNSDIHGGLSGSR